MELSHLKQIDVNISSVEIERITLYAVYEQPVRSNMAFPMASIIPNKPMVLLSGGNGDGMQRIFTTLFSRPMSYAPLSVFLNLEVALISNMSFLCIQHCKEVLCFSKCFQGFSIGSKFGMHIYHGQFPQTFKHIDDGNHLDFWQEVYHVFWLFHGNLW